MDGLDWLNRVSRADAAAALSRTCGCAGWAEAVAAERPFGTRDELFAAAERRWAQASREDVLEAFTHHPRIGDRASLRARFPQTHAWSAGEQSGAAVASDETLDALAAANREYEARFGHIFIVCATGKSADEMLGLLQARIGNDPEIELGIAAKEQMKITRLRLEKLLNEAPVALSSR